MELFTLEGATAAPRARQTAGRWLVQLRYDQILLTAIGCILGVTVIFACGVERGKQLVRSEDRFLARETQRMAPAAAPTNPPAGKPAAPAQQQDVSVPEAPRPRMTPIAPGKAAPVGTQRYAIQVVTYTRPQLASKELQRLQARGERAFLVKRQGRMIVYVGPFATQAHASEKLPTLKTRYQDCFVKTL